MAGVDRTWDLSSTGETPRSEIAISIPDSLLGFENANRHRTSSFDISLLSDKSIQKRELNEFSVHYSVSTSCWITRIVTFKEGERRCLSFSFAAEDDARKFGKAYSPPKMVVGGRRCFCCSTVSVGNCSLINCKNCGVQICEGCSRRWGIRMIPKTYLTSPIAPSSSTVRVCKSCNWLTSAFCMALLQGQHNNAVLIHATGNVNLRSTFADIRKEAMFPIHCAVIGGNLDLVKWLVEAHGCPLSVKRNPKSGILQSVQTSKGRSLMDLAMSGKPKTDILAYLVSKNLDVSDTFDSNLASKTLQSLMSTGSRSLGHLNNTCDASVSTVEDACIICYEKPMNCVFAPCGHQTCCSDCGNKLSECPLCKQAGSILRIFKS
jgi:hypothetical protein